MFPIMSGVGRVVAEPSVHTFEDSGTKVCNFKLVSNQKRKVNGELKEDSIFLEFQVWDSAAEVFEKYASKGTLIQYTAEPRTKNKKRDDGTYDNSVSFRITKFNFLGGGQRTESAEKTQNQEEEALF